MEDSWKKTGRVLVSAGLVTDELLERAEQAQKKVGQRLTETLIALGVDAEAIRQALATRFKVPEISLQDLNLDSDLVELIPESWVVKKWHYSLGESAEHPHPRNGQPFRY